MTTMLWTLIAIQIAMAAFDTIYHHELTERLAWRPSQRYELALHAARNFVYAALFLVLGFGIVKGVFAWIVIVALAVEVMITLADFVEEDMSRKLPATERVNHTLLAINYGAILVLIFPPLAASAMEATSVKLTSHGTWSALMMFASLGAIVFGLRDLLASRRPDAVSTPSEDLVKALATRQTVLVTGATGFIGTRLVQALNTAGHQVIVLTRDPQKAAALTPPFRLITGLSQLPDDTHIDAIVNLAGEPIANGPWTVGKRHAILASRLRTTGNIVRLIRRLTHKPAVLISGSAIGWYGLNGDETLTEASDGRACFTRQVCTDWERAAVQAERFGVRVVRLRIGLVLGIEGGMLANMLTPFEYGLGGPFGSGQQWMSWITRDDLVRLIAHAIATPSLSGPVNATAPEPVRNLSFAHELGRVLHRPAVLRLPAAPLRLAAGEPADELLLGGQRVTPEKALKTGFVFRHASLRGALAVLLDGIAGDNGVTLHRPLPHQPAAAEK
jgi:uncharacterized protein (TIGR01777 family)